VRTSTFAPDNKGKQGWKPVKSTNPDIGTYEPSKGIEKISKRTVSHFFIRPGTAPTTHEKETFTTVYTKMKKFVPGAGTYDAKITTVSRPYTRKRI